MDMIYLGGFVLFQQLILVLKTQYMQQMKWMTLIDRFLTINVDAKIEDWIDYALDKGLNTRLIEALATSEECFLGKR